MSRGNARQRSSDEFHMFNAEFIFVAIAAMIVGVTDFLGGVAGALGSAGR